MPIDPKKLRTYMATQEGRPGRPAVPDDDAPAASAIPAPVRPFLKPGQKPQELLSLLERGDDVTPEQLARLLSPKVGYMELDVDASGFACGNCGYAAPGGNCRNPAVLAPVSTAHGCCNLFWNEDDVVFPPAAKG